MKKRLLLISLITLLITAVGCGEEISDEIRHESSDVSCEESETVPTEEVAEETEPVLEEPEDEPEVQEIAELTFEELSKRRFEFCSGAGGWAENFTIEADGSFTGEFHDSDMGSTGEGYNGGTRYYSAYSGRFTNLTRIDDYTYQMTLADISYENTVGTEEILDDILYVYTKSYCLGGTDTFTIYLPGTPLDKLTEGIRSWLHLGKDSGTRLTMIVIADETNELGICSYERYEDAQVLLNSCKHLYNYYGKLLAEASTTAEMVEYTGSQYAVSDKCLNDIWSLIKQHVDEDKYSEILVEQREWIAEKEATAEEISAEYGDGSFEAVSYNDTLATLTLERCEELIEYLK